METTYLVVKIIAQFELSTHQSIKITVRRNDAMCNVYSLTKTSQSGNSITLMSISKLSTTNVPFAERMTSSLCTHTYLKFYFIPCKWFDTCKFELLSSRFTYKISPWQNVIHLMGNFSTAEDFLFVCVCYVLFHQLDKLYERIWNHRVQSLGAEQWNWSWMRLSPKVCQLYCQNFFVIIDDKVLLYIAKVTIRVSLNFSCKKVMRPSFK